MSDVWVTPDLMSAAADHITYEYGGHGYRLAPLDYHPQGGVSFTVLHGDGSEFRIAADPYGAVDRFCDRRVNGDVQQWCPGYADRGYHPAHPIGQDYLCEAHDGDRRGRPRERAGHC